MDSYELFLYWKQGDTFAAKLEKTPKVSDALKSWSKDFTRYRDICLQLAKALEGKNVTVDAGTHTILFQPKDKAADTALKSLVKEDLLSVADFGDDENL